MTAGLSFQTLELCFVFQAGVAEADAVILRMPLQALADNDADAQVTLHKR